ncbi:MAG: chemotaxis protein CheW [Treponema sp.]|nr:chemotaxis protein CheW [Treponema sp.]
MRQNLSKAKEKDAQNVDVNSSSYLVFTIDRHRYAFKSTQIQEIMYGAKIHHIPFVPPYIEGVLNCRGNPYTVINSLKLDNEPESDIPENVFLLFRRDDDHFCVHISNIEVFFEPEIEDVFEDRVKYKQKMVPLFDADRLETAMLRDLSGEDI